MAQPCALQLVTVDGPRLDVNAAAAAAVAAACTKRDLHVVLLIGAADAGPSAAAAALVESALGAADTPPLAADSFRPCAAGVWVWSAPLPSTDPRGGDVLLLATEAGDLDDADAGASALLLGLLVASRVCVVLNGPKLEPSMLAQVDAALARADAAVPGPALVYPAVTLLSRDGGDAPSGEIVETALAHASSNLRVMMARTLPSVGGVAWPRAGGARVKPADDGDALDATAATDPLRAVRGALFGAPAVALLPPSTAPGTGANAGAGPRSGITGAQWVTLLRASAALLSLPEARPGGADPGVLRDGVLMAKLLPVAEQLLRDARADCAAVESRSVALAHEAFGDAASAVPDAVVTAELTDLVFFQQQRAELLLVAIYDAACALWAPPVAAAAAGAAGRAARPPPPVALPPVVDDVAGRLWEALANDRTGVDALKRAFIAASSAAAARRADDAALTAASLAAIEARVHEAGARARDAVLAGKASAHRAANVGRGLAIGLGVTVAGAAMVAGTVVTAPLALLAAVVATGMGVATAAHGVFESDAKQTLRAVALTNAKSAAISGLTLGAGSAFSWAAPLLGRSGIVQRAVAAAAAVLHAVPEPVRTAAGAAGHAIGEVVRAVPAPIDNAVAAAVRPDRLVVGAVGGVAGDVVNGRTPKLQSALVGAAGSVASGVASGVAGSGVQAVASPVVQSRAGDVIAHAAVGAVAGAAGSAAGATAATATANAVRGAPLTAGLGRAVLTSTAVGSAQGAVQGQAAAAAAARDAPADKGERDFKRAAT